MATLDLSKIEAKDAEMPATRRGRTAEPIPDTVLSWVKDSYSGAAKSIKVPNGEKNDKGNDTNVTAMAGLLRRAATSLGLGLSVAIKPPTARTTEIVFKAKDKTERTRLTKEAKRIFDYFTEQEFEEFPVAEFGEDNEDANAAWERYIKD